VADLIIPEGYGSATMTWTNADLPSPVTVTCGFKNNVAFSPPEVVAEAIFGYWVDLAAPCHADQMMIGWTFDSVYVLQDRGDGLESATYASPVAGSQVIAGNPQQPAYSPLVVSKTTSSAGKKFRGRMYPPMTYGGEPSVSVAGYIEPLVALPQIRANYAALFDAWDGGDFTPYLLHSDATAPTPINSFLVRPIVGTQRRRKAR